MRLTKKLSSKRRNYVKTQRRGKKTKNYRDKSRKQKKNTRKQRGGAQGYTKLSQTDYPITELNLDLDLDNPEKYPQDLSEYSLETVSKITKKNKQVFFLKSVKDRGTQVFFI